MTDAQVEQVAREFCRQLGTDPEQMIAHGAEQDPRTGICTLQVCYSPAWKIAAKEVRRRAMMDEAFRVLKPEVTATPSLTHPVTTI